jgi:hypothetical protein
MISMIARVWAVKCLDDYKGQPAIYLIYPIIIEFDLFSGTIVKSLKDNL